MSRDKLLSELSNAEFIEVLRSREADCSWTVGRLSEYENRVSGFLYDNTGLKDKIDSFIEEYHEKIRVPFEPYRESLEKIAQEESRSFIAPNFLSEAVKFRARRAVVDCF